MELPELSKVTSEQIRAARALIRWEQKDLAIKSNVSLPTIKRLETRSGQLQANTPTIDAMVRALEDAGIIFVEENGDGVGVRLKKGIEVLPRLASNGPHRGAYQRFLGGAPLSHKKPIDEAE